MPNWRIRSGPRNASRTGKQKDGPDWRYEEEKGVKEEKEEEEEGAGIRHIINLRCIISCKFSLSITGKRASERK